jgi:hypothetical protein
MADLPTIVNLKKYIEDICIRNVPTTMQFKLHIIKLLIAIRKCLDPNQCFVTKDDQRLNQLVQKPKISSDDFCEVVTPIINELQFPFTTRNLNSILQEYDMDVSDLTALDQMTNVEEMYEWLSYLSKKQKHKKSICCKKKRN